MGIGLQDILKTVKMSKTNIIAQAQNTIFAFPVSKSVPTKSGIREEPRSRPEYTNPKMRPEAPEGVIFRTNMSRDGAVMPERKPDKANAGSTKYD